MSFTLHSLGEPIADCRYNKLCGSMRSLINRISLLPAEDPFRQQKESEMLNKLFDMGILGELSWVHHRRT